MWWNGIVFIILLPHRTEIAFWKLCETWYHLYSRVQSLAAFLKSPLHLYSRVQSLAAFLKSPLRLVTTSLPNTKQFSWLRLTLVKLRLFRRRRINEENNWFKLLQSNFYKQKTRARNTQPGNKENMAFSAGPIPVKIQPEDIHTSTFSADSSELLWWWL